jgi:putative phosphoserine phosphatase / 1-acylglycerol-3-phosphate O-acyltransferase
LSLALFDLDRTLIDCNSGRLWMLHEWRARRIGLRDLAWGSYWLTRYGLGREDGLDTAMEWAVSSVVGVPEVELDARVRAWFEREVRHRLRRRAREVLARHRDRGDRMVLASSGTLYAVRAAAEAYGFEEVVCTRLEVDGAGLLTGRLATLAVGRAKERAVRAWADEVGADLATATFYTDSASDLALLEAVQTPVAVNPDRALRRIAAARGWPVEDWGPCG